MSLPELHVAPPLPAVALRGVRKAYGDLVVLDGVDLAVPAAQRVALIGPSGSGKSTILRLLMGLERPDAGRIEIGGRSLWTRGRLGAERPADAAHLRAVRSQVGMVFQQFQLFPHMNVLRNVTEAPVHVLGMRRDRAQARAVDLLEMVGLSDKLDSRPAELSGGQKQRVAIARALAMHPEVMLFDEITSALDPELVGEVLGVLRTIADERPTTMLLVTHQIHFAREFADWVLFLDAGGIVESGPPAQVIDAPQNERTREFLRAVLGP